jgi:hypothetical protein
MRNWAVSNLSIRTLLSKVNYVKYENKQSSLSARELSSFISTYDRNKQTKFHAGIENSRYVNALSSHIWFAAPGLGTNLFYAKPFVSHIAM